MKSQVKSRVLSKLIDQLEALSNGGGEQSRQRVVRLFVAVISLILTGLIGNVLGTYVTQEMLGYSFPLLLIVIMFFIYLFATILQVAGLPYKLHPLQVLAVLLTLAVIQSVIIAWMYVENRPSTVYLIFDATESAIPNYPELIEKIRLTAQVQDPKSLGGLRIYGGGLSDQDSCRDTTQLIAPVQARDFERELSDAFGKFDPRGNASLTTAVLLAVKDDLKCCRGPIKLVVIASGLDPQCEPPWGGIFEEIAADIRTHTSKNITIAIIGVGELTPTEQKTLKNYAQAFDGTFLNTSKTADLSSLILASRSYVVGYNENSRD